MNINNRIVETHHQLACAPFCHATSKNGMNKKIVTIGRIFDRNLMTCWFWIFRRLMGKKRKDKIVRRFCFSHAFLRESISIEESHRQLIPRLTDRDRKLSVIRFDLYPTYNSRTRWLFSFFFFLSIVFSFTCLPFRIDHWSRDR